MVHVFWGGGGGGGGSVLKQYLDRAVRCCFGLTCASLCTEKDVLLCLLVCTSVASVCRCPSSDFSQNILL